MTIRTIMLNHHNALHYDTSTGAWDINQPPEPDEPVRPRRVIFHEIEALGIVATPDAIERIDMLPERTEFRDDD